MKILLIILFIGSIPFTGLSQYTKEDTKSNTLKSVPFKDRLFTGGNIGFNIFNNYLFLDLSPIIGYKITPKLGAGVGLRYSLLRDMTTKQNWSNYGGSIFARYKLIPQIFLHTEFEVLQSYDYNPFSPTYGDRAPAYMWFAGAGYSTSNSGGLNFSILLLYDLIDHINSPYQNAYLFGNSGPPIIVRGGATIGF